MSATNTLPDARAGQDVATLWRTIKTEDKRCDGTVFGLKALIANHPDLPLEAKADEIFEGLITRFTRLSQCLEAYKPPFTRPSWLDATDSLFDQRILAQDAIPLYVRDAAQSLTNMGMDEKESYRFMGKIIRAAVDVYEIKTGTRLYIDPLTLPRPASR